MRISSRGKLAAAITVLAVVAFGGGAYAASQDSRAVGRQAFLSDVAKRLNVSPSQLESALQAAFLDQLNAAVAAGRLTRAQADMLTQRMQRDATGGLGALGGLGHLRDFSGPGRLGDAAGPGALRDRGWPGPARERGWPQHP